MTLLTPAELAGIQALGEMGMTADVGLIPSSFDSGNDLTDDPYGSSLTYGSVTQTVKGWLVGRWSERRDPDTGDIDTTTIYRLRLPVGTTIEPGWLVEINSNRYLVIDAGTDQTWPEWLTCVVKRAK